MSSLQLTIMDLGSITSKKSGSGPDTSVFSAFHSELCFRVRQMDAQSQLALCLRAVQLTPSSVNIQPNPLIPVPFQPHHTPLLLHSFTELCSPLKLDPNKETSKEMRCSMWCQHPLPSPSSPAPTTSPFTPLSQIELILGGHEDGQDT